jgi:small neutral amino acid transporter SnatA (MarC family)
MFGISLPAFQAGGGIILFLIAVQMTLIGVSTEKTAAASKDHSAREDIAIVRSRFHF